MGHRYILASILASLIASSTAGAQVRARSGPTYATREQLTAIADSIGAAASTATFVVRQEKALEESVFRDRLSEGDFQPGDLIDLTVEGEAALSDTFPVRSGRVLALPGIGEMSVDGVLRVELEARVTAFLSEYIRTPRVRVVPLVRVAVVGAVTRPGYYSMAADTPLSEALMKAGGPGARADLKRLSIRRGTRELWVPSYLRLALSEGMTLDELHLRGGDEILVREKRSMGLQTVLSAAGIITGLATLAIALKR